MICSFIAFCNFSEIIIVFILKLSTIPSSELITKVTRFQKELFHVVLFFKLRSHLYIISSAEV
ncbi:hypothetical protein HMPREF1981_02657 [Bacteroides pyogenes F0041]|uniref:Uncharacterized protein n=1 Tax=Bacteroides pyogenes F0041 TaxID=1321819 RepID=U2BVC7_9BACE|nr:hypothetical protein HMPREF1981_02657 [Bacteroides pyogenes F0041]